MTSRSADLVQLIPTAWTDYFCVYRRSQGRWPMSLPHHFCLNWPELYTDWLKRIPLHLFLGEDPESPEIHYSRWDLGMVTSTFFLWEIIQKNFSPMGFSYPGNSKKKFMVLRGPNGALWVFWLILGLNRAILINFP